MGEWGGIKEGNRSDENDWSLYNLNIPFKPR